MLNALARLKVFFLSVLGHVRSSAAFVGQKAGSPIQSEKASGQARRAFGSQSSRTQRARKISSVTFSSGLGDLTLRGSNSRQGLVPSPVTLGRQCSSLALKAFLPAACGFVGALVAGRQFAANGLRRGRRSVTVCQARGGGEDFYNVLGVSKSSNDREIKTAFRKLARQWHPDVNKEPGAQERFQKIARAYEVLSDEQKRRRYDQFGEAGVEGMAAGPDMASLNLEDIIGDVFGNFFGGRMGGMNGMPGMRGRQQRGPQKGSDLQFQVEVSFDVACFGGERVVQVQREETCLRCEGKGVKTGMDNVKCRRCSGAGVTVQAMNTSLGVMQTQQVCASCGGNGVDPSAVCPECKGKGTTPELKEVYVKVPGGCATGNQLRMRGEGNKGVQGGPPGDLYIFLRVQESEYFGRKGFDIYTEEHVRIFDAVLGASIVVKTIDGDAEIKIPAGTQPEARMRIKGRGVVKLGKQGERGDHYVIIKIDVPRDLSPEQQQKIRELQADLDSPG